GGRARRPGAGGWARARAVALEALSGHVMSSVGEATHYHANYVAPYWGRELVKVSQIGAHIFYRWPGAWGQPAAFNGRYAGGEALWRAAGINLPAVGQDKVQAGPAEPPRPPTPGRPPTLAPDSH